MSAPTVKSIHLKTTYTGDLSQLKADIATVKSIRRQIEKTPIRVAIRLDTSSLKSEAAKAAAVYQSEMQKAMNSIRPGQGGGTMSAGGIFVPPGAMKDLGQFRAAVGRETKIIERTVEGSKARVVKSFEQIQQGLARETTLSTNRKGQTTKSVSLIDTRPIENFKKAMADIDKKFGYQLGAARGSKGDVAGILELKKREIDSKLSEFANLEGTPVFQKAKASLVRLDQTLSQAGASQKLSADTKAQKQAQLDRVTGLKGTLDKIDSDFAKDLGKAKGGKGDVESVIRQKRQRLEAELKSFGDLAGTAEYRRATKMLASMDQLQAQSGASQQRAAAAEQAKNYKTFAERTIHNDDRRLQTAIKESKANEAVAKAIGDRTVREAELNRIMDEREALISKQQKRYGQLAADAKAKGYDTAANQFTNAGNRVGNDLNQIRLDRTRERQRSESVAVDKGLEKSLDAAMRYNQQQRANLVLEEKAASQISNRARREAAINDILRRRAALLQGTRNAVSDVHFEASRRGNTALAGKAEKAGSGLAVQATRDMDRLSAATTRSTHANQFHSSSLLKNAISFTRWTLAMTAVTAPLAAIGSGVSSAIQLERTFKTLNAVYRGSREDAKLLAQETLLLAAANGRDGQEAAEAAVAWSRLGMTRTQVLLAVETSLRAANVAEITAAEATGYLTAAYKNFHQTVLDIPQTLDYLNSLSNSNADKVKDMFNSIARGGKVAEQAGLTLREFAAISATVGEATQRPGAEFGNASKAIFNRIRKPETLEKLKSDFGMDFTTPSGDVMKMADIIGKLAEIYPTLNRAEQTRLTLLIAGSNQSNRAAVMLETYTDALIAQSVASADSNSAARENAEILNSVDAGLQMVATSWNALILSLAEMGAFQAVSAMLRGLTDDLGTVSTLMNKVGKAGKNGDGGKSSYKVSERTAKIATATAERGLQAVVPFMNPDPSPSQEELKWLRWKLQGTVPGASLKQGLDVDKLTPEEKAAMIAEIEAALAKGPTFETPPPNKSSAIVLDSQRKIDSFNSGSKAFTALSKDVFSKDSKQVLSSFDEAMSILEQLPNGAKERLDAMGTIRPLIEKGDRGGASAELRKRAEALANAGIRERDSLELKRPEMVAEADKAMQKNRDRLASLERERADAAGNPAGQKKIQEEIMKTTDLLKAQQDAYDVITRKQTDVSGSDPFDEKRRNLAAYVEDLGLVGEAFGQLLTELGSTGFADLDSKLRIGGARMKGDLFESSLADARRQNADAISSAENTLSIYQNKKPWEYITPEMTHESDEKKAQALRDQLNLYGEIDAALEKQIEETRQATREEERKLEIARQTAKLKESFDDGSASAAAGSTRYAIGRSEGERLINQTRGTMTDLSTSLRTPTPSSAGTAANQLGQLTERLKGSKGGLLSIEERLNRAIADRANLEYQIAEQAVRQREEASKRLALASREDQLRAAAAKAFLKNSGTSSFSMRDFQYFSQETRGAISNLMPGAVRGLDDTDRDNSEARAKLDDEIRLLSVSLTELRKTFTDLRPKAEEKGGQLGTKVRPESAAPDVSKDKVDLHVNMGEVRINIDMAPHIQTIVGLIKPQFSSELGRALQNLRRELGGRPMPDTSPAAGTY